MKHPRFRTLLMVLVVGALTMIAPTSVGADGASLEASRLLVLVERGKSQYEIVVDSRAVEGVREAAKEFQRLVEKAAGVRLPIVQQPTRGRSSIVIGSHRLATKAGVTDLGLVNDSYRIRAVSGNLYLVGKDDAVLGFYTLNNNQSASAGSYYAVLEFARRYLHARWYMPGPLGEEVPSSSRLAVPTDLDLEVSPRFPIRAIDVAMSKDRERQERLLRQGDLPRIYYDEETARAASVWGRHLRLGNNFQLTVQHAWHQWLPAETPTKYSPQAYGRSHPEYFAVPGGKNGKYYYGSDHAHGGQVCMANPAVATEIARNIITYARDTTERSFSLSPNDGDWECASSCCGNWADRIDQNELTHTDRVLEFSNRVAEQVLKEIPDARFGLYAYYATINPPQQVRANPRIDISDVYNGWPYLYRLPEKRAAVESQIRGWRKGTESVVLTTYYTFEGNYSLPWSSYDALAWMIGLLAQYPSSAGVRMNFAQLDPAPMGLTGPDPWLLSELLWDPSQSPESLRAEYFIGAFGPKAGPLLRKYFDVINGAMAETIPRVVYREANSPRDYIVPVYGSVRAECRSLIAAATAAVGNEDERFRWRVDRIARGWELVEKTLDALAAEKTGDRIMAERLWAIRDQLLAEQASRLALAQASAAYFQKLVPLGKSH